MGNKDKDTEHSDAEAMGERADAACDACQASGDLSHERATALDKMVTDAVARETAWLTMTFMAILNERVTVNMSTSLKVISGDAGIKAMPLFYWAKHKAIYQRWQ